MTTYYKVLRSGRPCHGGDPNFVWPLPTDQAPGEWVEHHGSLYICATGLHLTSEPARWYEDGTDLYEAEYDGEFEQDGDKICVRWARLLRKVPWETGLVFLGGTHSIRYGHALASGSATVDASGNATVWASGNATVWASGSATVDASGNATVWASGSATVDAYGNATVDASDSATVRASDSATVDAYGSTTVRAYGNATVWAYDSANIISMSWHATEAMVELHDAAVHIDRRQGVTVRMAEAAV